MVAQNGQIGLNMNFVIVNINKHLLSTFLYNIDSVSYFLSLFKTINLNIEENISDA